MIHQFISDCHAARAVWGRKDAWCGEEPKLAQRAWNGLQYSAANAEQWSNADQTALESARIEFDTRQRLAFSVNSEVTKSLKGNVGATPLDCNY